MVQNKSGGRSAGADVGDGLNGTTRRTQRVAWPSPPLPVRTLTRWPVPRANEILVVPVGGLGQIGMNWTFYGHDGRWIGVDAGIAFTADRSSGVDAIAPDPEAIRPILGRLEGLVVTHAHEDHIGAIDRFWPGAVNCPIHVTPFAEELVSRRFGEIGAIDDVDLVPFEVGASFDVGPFSIRTIAVTHSVPEPVALALSCPAGTLVHTGDFKLDPDPLLGQSADLDAFREVGDQGVLAMVCDSTNADRDIPTSSEAQVREAFRSVMASRKGAVVVCCFASNVARMASAMIAAEAAGRHVALAGRSMRTNEDIADGLGMLDDIPRCLAEPKHLEGLDRNRIALICTGTQGEERAALSKLSQGNFRLPRIGHGDTVVMSARVIPGNESAVEAVLSKLRARGVEVIDAKSLIDGNPVHVSGHAGRAELRTLHRLVRPRFALPVHGQREQLEAHAVLAIECGAEAAPVADEGHVLSFSPSGMKTLGRVPIPHIELRNDSKGNKVPLSAVSGGDVSAPTRIQHEPRSSTMAA